MRGFTVPEGLEIYTKQSLQNLVANFSIKCNFVSSLYRSTAKDKETKDHKYALISSICAQKEVNNLIPGELLKQLRTYVQQGAFYKESTVEVAIEEQ